MTTEYRIIEDEAGGDIYITENSQYNHVNCDNVTVAENITARLFGTIRNKIVIRKGARLYLHGSNGGPVENEGGEFFRY